MRTMCVRASTTYSDMLVFCLCAWHTLHCVMLIHQVPCVWPTDDWDGDPGTSKCNRATSKLYGQST